MVEFACQQCGKTCSVEAGKAKAYPYRPARKYCSRPCFWAARKIAERGAFVQDGYRYFYIDGKNVAEHRLVMERHLGRSLQSYETVHHRDGDRLNNDIVNLELWSSRHCKGQRVSEKIDFCREFLSEYGINVPLVSAGDYLAGISGLV